MFKWPFVRRSTFEAVGAAYDYLVGEHFKQHCRANAAEIKCEHLRRDNNAIAEQAVRLAHENDRLRTLLADAHVRDPITKRLLPKGQFQLEVAQ